MRLIHTASLHTGFDPLGLLDPTVSNGSGAGGFVNPRWLQYSEVSARVSCVRVRWECVCCVNSLMC